MLSCKLFAFCLITLLCTIERPSHEVAAKNVKRGINGGLDCAVCTVLFGLASQVAQLHNDTLIDASLRLCSVLPARAGSTCSKAVKIFEPVLLDQRLQKILTPDVICYGFRLCYKTPGEKYCNLFPAPRIGFRTALHRVQHAIEKKVGPSHLTWNLCLLPGIREICDAIEKSINREEPAWDADDDWFSTAQSARGSFWRGRDCDDLDPLVYPGRVAKDGDVGSDSNCNGIFGRNPATGKSLEEQLCHGTGARGLIYMGDSVGAHFHFPRVWMDPLQISWALISNVSIWILNEGDWPELGFATGYMNTSQPALIKGYTDSIYLRLKNRNRCNHRDYQNLARNGAASNNVLHYMKSVARNGTSDKPALVIFGLYGNDVCNNFVPTVDNMTSPKEFHSNIMQVLNLLETKLPLNSHVLLIGLVDASFIYPTMADRIHPLGTLHKNIKYDDLYKWFTCMQIGPCNGWMTPDSKLRKITTKASVALSNVLKDIASSVKFTNFKLHYLDNPLAQVMYEWKQQGHPLWQLIDPVDSLHPSQLAQPLIADVLWRNINASFPEILGKLNPHNQKISDLFGEQGGY